MGTGTLSSEASALLAENIKASETFNGHTYTLTTTAMTWSEAKSVASELGGYLTTINTKSENDWLTSNFYLQYSSAIWIGASDQATEGTWVWDHGTTSNDDGLTDDICGTSSDCKPSDATWTDGTRKWNNGEPNNSGGEDCANITNSSGFWNDLPCTRNQYGIIEFDQ